MLAYKVEDLAGSVEISIVGEENNGRIMPSPNDAFSLCVPLTIQLHSLAMPVSDGS